MKAKDYFWMRSAYIKDLLPKITIPEIKAKLEFQWVQLLARAGWSRKEIMEETGFNYSKVRRLQVRGKTK